MAITYVAEAHNQNAAGANSTSLVVNKPTGTVDDDIMIAQVTHQQTGAITVTAPTDWILIDNFITAAVSPQTETKMFIKLASSEGASYTWTQSTSTPFAVAISSWRGAVGIHARSTMNEVSSAGSITTNSATSTVTGVPIYFASTSLTASVVETTFTASGTEIYDHGNDNGSINMTQAAYYGSSVAAGTVSGLAITFSQTVTHGIGYTLVLADTGTAFWPFAATGTFICPTGLTTADVRVWGGGGGGGAGTANPGSGGGGAGGSFSRKATFAVTAGTSYTATVAAATTSATTGGATGGTSWFSSNDTNGVVAVGGPGGAEGTSTTAGGAGGTGTSTGNFGDGGSVFAGGNGSTVATDLGGAAGGGAAGTTGAGGNASASTAGTGTAIGGGDGAAGKAVSTAAGLSGVVPGGGGGGGNTTAAGNSNGGIGAAGSVIIYLTPSTGTSVNPGTVTATSVANGATETIHANAGTVTATAVAESNVRVYAGTVTAIAVTNAPTLTLTTRANAGNIAATSVADNASRAYAGGVMATAVVNIPTFYRGILADIATATSVAGGVSGPDAGAVSASAVANNVTVFAGASAEGNAGAVAATAVANAPALALTSNANAGEVSAEAVAHLVPFVEYGEGNPAEVLVIVEVDSPIVEFSVNASAGTATATAVANAPASALIVNAPAGAVMVTAVVNNITAAAVIRANAGMVTATSIADATVPGMGGIAGTVTAIDLAESPEGQSGANIANAGTATATVTARIASTLSAKFVAGGALVIVTPEDRTCEIPGEWGQLLHVHVVPRPHEEGVVTGLNADPAAAIASAVANGCGSHIYAVGKATVTATVNGITLAGTNHSVSPGTVTATAVANAATKASPHSAGTVTATVTANNVTKTSTSGPHTAGAVSATAVANSATVSVFSNNVYVVEYGTPQLAANAASGKHLIFPSSTTYTVTNLLIPANCYIEGNNSTLKYPNNSTVDSSTSDSILKVNGSGVTVDNLNFDGNIANQSGIWSQHRHCVRILGTFSNVEVKNCDMLNIIGDGVYINTQSGSNNKVHNCTFTANYDNRNGVSVVTGTTIEIYSNTFTHCTRDSPPMPGPIDIEPNASSDTLSAILVHDNTIVGGSTAGTGTIPGIVYSGFQNASGSNIQIYNNDISGTRFTSGTLAIGNNGGPFNNVSGLKFYGNNVHAIGSTGKIGAELDYWIGADVYNNTFNGMQYGIYNYQACLGTSTGNTFTGVTTNITNDNSHCS